jgi:PAS domain S-box-containing protein
VPRTTIEGYGSGREGAPEAERPSADTPYANFPGEGEMAERCRALDWAATPLGPVQAWSPRLRAAAELVLDAALPMVLLWGPELVQLYNDGYRALMGAKHPAGLGQPTRECWPEVWHLNAPVYERVRAGEAVLLEDALFPTTRSGTLDDAWFTLSYSPARDDDGTVAGVLVTVAETTVQVRARATREAERERLLAESEAARRQVTATLESIADAFYAVDAEFRFTYVNRKAEQLWGRPREELVGRHYWTEFPQAVGSESHRRHQEVMAERRPLHYRTVSPVTGLTIDVGLYPAADGGLACYFRDATDEARAAEALRASEARLRLALDMAELGTWTWDLETGAGDLDARAAAIVGLPAGAFHDVAAAQFAAIHPDDLAPTQAAPAAGIAGGRPFDLHYRVVPPDGGVRHVASRASVVADAEGRPVRLVGTNRDVTAEREAADERVRLLAELGTERERLRSVVLHTPAPLALTEGPEHRFTLVNEAYKRASGGGRDVTGLTPRTAFPELEGSGIHEVFDQVYATGEPWVGTETLVRYDRDGTGLMDTWFDLRFEPVRNAEGHVVGVLNLAVDVTEQVAARHAVEELLAQSERARAEAEAARMALAASEVQFRMLADAIPTLAWTAQADGYIDWYNARWYEYTGTTPEQMEGWGWQSVHDPAALPDVIAQWQASIATGAVFEMTFPLRGADGQFRPFLTRIVPLRDASGRVVRWVGTNADVTSEREARAAAERAQAGAEAANRAKGEFLAVMSHELRTPLNAIGGYAELLELGIRGPITDAQRADLARIQASQKHLLGLINQVLNYTRVDAGAVRYDLTGVPVADAVVAAEALVLPQARARGLTLTIGDCPPGLVARADPDKLQQVLLNLLTNAVKFTEAGGELRVTCAEREAEVAISVADTGVGIAAEKLASIFEPFVQVDQGLTRPHEGVGLGLAISRELARGMGGDLTAESTPGVGSTFTLTLPRA